MVISHTQERLTADHKGMPSARSTSRNGLEQNKLDAIPLVNKRVDVVFTSIVKVTKGEECVTIDVNRVHFECPVCLKRLQFNKVSS